MAAWHTRGQPVALAAVAAYARRGNPPPALLLAGPSGSGKTTLALDLAAALLCTAVDPAERPCRSCSACRRVAHGNHPDLHRLAPSGPGRQIRIGERAAPEPGTVRALVRELALAPMEGAWRVAIVEEAERMNQDAQNALLKLLEEPPPATVLMLCASDDERLLPTVRSRCVRVRLGRVPQADIADLLAGEGIADPVRAASLAALADGRPGRALALAAAPEAVILQEQILRELLDLTRLGRAERLAAAAGLLAEGDRLQALLDSGGAPVEDAAPADEAAGDGRRDRQAPGARRRALLALLPLWLGLARDLALAGRGGRAELRHMALLEELVAAAANVPAGAAETFLERVSAMTGAVEGNANPELVLDVLLLAWPYSGRGA
ncbi:MAG: DNA polymerase III subunit delta' [Candidatus Limnocylindrales bacterium]